MTFLETRIPPLALVFIFAFIMYAVSHYAYPTFVIPQAALAVQKPVYTLFTLTGFALTILGVLSFRKAKTTVDPRDPNKSNSLVVVGVYKLTRNPMYIGFLFCLIAWGIYLNDAMSLAFAFLFIPYMNRFQIKIEERFLEQNFGQAFLDYKAQVRRWL